MEEASPVCNNHASQSVQSSSSSSRSPGHAGREVCVANDLCCSVESSASPSVQAFQDAFRACEVKRDWKKCLRVMAAMRRAGLEPDLRTYNIVVQVCERSRQYGQVLSLLQGMWQSGPEPNLGTYMAVLHACRRSQMKDWAFHVLAEALRRGIKP